MSYGIIYIVFDSFFLDLLSTPMKHHPCPGQQFQFSSVSESELGLVLCPQLQPTSSWLSSDSAMIVPVPGGPGVSL